MSGSEIARRTGLSPRRVRRLLHEIISSKGVVFGIARNPARGSGINFYLKIVWDDKVSNAQNLIKKIQAIYPEATWESYISLSAPVFFTKFVVEHIKETESISNLISEFDEVKSLETLVLYPARISSILARECLRKDILEAGYEICGF